MCGLSITLILKGKFDVLKSKSPYLLLNKNKSFNKNETESNIKSPCFLLDKNKNFNKN